MKNFYGVYENNNESRFEYDVHYKDDKYNELLAVVKDYGQDIVYEVTLIPSHQNNNDCFYSVGRNNDALIYDKCVVGTAKVNSFDKLEQQFFNVKQNVSVESIESYTKKYEDKPVNYKSVNHEALIKDTLEVLVEHPSQIKYEKAKDIEDKVELEDGIIRTELNDDIEGKEIDYEQREYFERKYDESEIED